MRIWSARPDAETGSGTEEAAVVSAVDAALGYVAGQGWVPRQTAIALVETVRDVAGEVHAPEQLHRLIHATLESCAQDRVLAATLVDELLDIRNAARPAVAPRS